MPSVKWLLTPLAAGLLSAAEVHAQVSTPVRFEPAAWYSALSEEFSTGSIQIQVGKTTEGPVVKAVFDDSVKAALPFEAQEEAARTVARYIMAHAAPAPALAVIIVGWRGSVEGMPVAQTFRFATVALAEGPTTPKAQ